MSFQRNFQHREVCGHRGVHSEPKLIGASLEL
jgi:hypothetical protein